MNHGDDLIDVIGSEKIGELRETYVSKYEDVIDIDAFTRALRSNLIAFGLTIKARTKQVGPRYSSVSTMGEEARKFYRLGDDLWALDETQTIRNYGNLSYLRVHDGLFKLWSRDWLDVKMRGAIEGPIDRGVAFTVQAGLDALAANPVKLPPSEFEVGTLFPRRLDHRKERVPYVVFREGFKKIEPLTQLMMDSGEAVGEVVIRTESWWPALQAFNKDARFWEVAIGTVDDVNVVAMTDNSGNVAMSTFADIDL